MLVNAFKLKENDCNLNKYTYMLTEALVDLLCKKEYCCQTGNYVHFIQFKYDLIFKSNCLLESG